METMSPTHQASSSSERQGTSVVVQELSRPVAKSLQVSSAVIKAPKKPLSAYNIFFQLERENILKNEEDQNYTQEHIAWIASMHQARRRLGSKRKHRKSHGVIGFKDLASVLAKKVRRSVNLCKKIAECRSSWGLTRSIFSSRLLFVQWKKLDPAVKELFEHRAAIEKAVYKSELSSFLANNAAKQTVERENSLASQKVAAYGASSKHSGQKSVPDSMLHKEATLNLMNKKAGQQDNGEFQAAETNRNPHASVSQDLHPQCSEYGNHTLSKYASLEGAQDDPFEDFAHGQSFIQNNRQLQQMSVNSSDCNQPLQILNLQFPLSEHISKLTVNAPYWSALEESLVGAHEGPETPEEAEEMHRLLTSFDFELF